jgi:hypothetical protein
MITYEWTGARAGGAFHNYLFREDTEELARAIGIAAVRYTGSCYRVVLYHTFDALVPPNAYIRKHKYPTLEAAKRAVERRVPPLVAVLKIRGELQL